MSRVANTFGRAHMLIDFLSGFNLPPANELPLRCEQSERHDVQKAQRADCAKQNQQQALEATEAAHFFERVIQCVDRVSTRQFLACRQCRNALLQSFEIFRRRERFVQGDIVIRDLAYQSLEKEAGLSLRDPVISTYFRINLCEFIILKRRCAFFLKFLVH